MTNPVSGIDAETMAVYEQHADDWKAQGNPDRVADAQKFAGRVRSLVNDSAQRQSDVVVDLGCGPGWYAGALGRPIIALDASKAMLDLVPSEAPHALRVQADLATLPFRAGSLAGAWASKCYVHLPQTSVPLALADLHHTLAAGTPLNLHVFAGDLEFASLDVRHLPGRRFSTWPPERLVDVVTGAGFVVDEIEIPDQAGRPSIIVDATRAPTLPDYVGADMRILICGLNPSVYSAEVGVGFGRPGNRFWTAALGAGLASEDRNPLHAFRDHRMGMTDLVKRATPKADALSRDEYRLGMARITRLVEWLQPKAVCFVGLAGWRAAVDRTAVAGVQTEGIGDVPVYVMPSTSGLNARTTPTQLREHLSAAAKLADAR
ncbi:MAG: uracil-DNA glycosylase family protein [Actinomycetes bacterium]